MPQNITRREFIEQSLTVGAVMAASYAMPMPVYSKSKSANEKLNIACVGTANRASAAYSGLRNETFVAICDVDKRFLDKRAKDYPQATQYSDFRKMLEKEEKNIDAVYVATPDHIHAPATAMALRMGKHAYTEKPIAHTVEECRILAELAKRHKCVTQMGTQIHAGDNYRRVVELIQSGAIGKVREAHVWIGKSWSGGRFRTPKTPPAHLDWDLWLGPAPKQPYCDGIHPANWRRYWDYGTGTLGDMACHFMDLVHWALDLRTPTKVWSEGPEVHEVGTPKWMIAHYEHPARGEQPPVKVTWYDGGKRPEILKKLKDKKGKSPNWGGGQLFVGDKGILLSDYGKYVLFPVEKFEGFTPPPQTIAKSIGHHIEWTEACKGRGKTLCNFDYSGALSETVLLGNVAFRCKQKLDWDPKTLRALNTKSADKFVRKEYRKGWDLVRDALS